VRVVARRFEVLFPPVAAGNFLPACGQFGRFPILSLHGPAVSLSNLRAVTAPLLL